MEILFVCKVAPRIQNSINSRVPGMACGVWRKRGPDRVLQMRGDGRA